MGTLFLLPNTFDDAQSPTLLLPEGLPSVISRLTGLIAESERSGRRYLCKLLASSEQARSMPIFLLNEHTANTEYVKFGNLLDAGATLGLVSDAGMPVVADPGSGLIFYLRRNHNVKISALPGPSSIFLALALSGLPAQSFTFHGYLPTEPAARRHALKRMEAESAHTGYTQICIETPYRNAAFFRDCLEVFHPSTLLSVVCRVTFDDEEVEMRSVGEWKRAKKDIRKLPTIFLACSSSFSGSRKAAG